MSVATDRDGNLYTEGDLLLLGEGKTVRDGEGNDLLAGGGGDIAAALKTLFGEDYQGDVNALDASRLIILIDTSSENPQIRSYALSDLLVSDPGDLAYHNTLNGNALLDTLSTYLRADNEYLSDFFAGQNRAVPPSPGDELVIYINRSSDGVLRVTSIADMYSTVAGQLNTYTVSSLPDGVDPWLPPGTIAAISDGGLESVGDSPMGGGSNYRVVIFNGSSWTIT